MNKYFLILAVIGFHSVVNAQGFRFKIIDKITRQPIPNCLVLMSNNEQFFSSDDGIVNLPTYNCNSIIIRHLNYATTEIKCDSSNPIITLDPITFNIPEITIYDSSQRELIHIKSKKYARFNWMAFHSTKLIRFYKFDDIKATALIKEVYFNVLINKLSETLFQFEERQIAFRLIIYNHLKEIVHSELSIENFDNLKKGIVSFKLSNPVTIDLKGNYYSFEILGEFINDTILFTDLKSNIGLKFYKSKDTNTYLSNHYYESNWIKVSIDNGFSMDSQPMDMSLNLKILN